jgi:hypothetical protein
MLFVLIGGGAGGCVVIFGLDRLEVGPGADAVAEGGPIVSRPCDLAGMYAPTAAEGLAPTLFGIPSTDEDPRLGGTYDELTAHPLPDGCFAVGRTNLKTGAAAVHRYCAPAGDAGGPWEVSDLYRPPPDASAPYVAVGPNGIDVAVVGRGVAEVGPGDTSQNLFRGKLSDGGVDQLALWREASSTLNDSRPSFGPDGTLYFTRDPPAAVQLYFLAVDADAAAPIRVSGGGASKYAPMLAPDGYLYFGSGSDLPIRLARAPLTADAGVLGAVETLTATSNVVPAGVSRDGCTLYVRTDCYAGCCAGAPSCSFRIVAYEKPR